MLPCRAADEMLYNVDGSVRFSQTGAAVIAAARELREGSILAATFSYSAGTSGVEGTMVEKDTAATPLNVHVFG